MRCAGSIALPNVRLSPPPTSKFRTTFSRRRIRDGLLYRMAVSHVGDPDRTTMNIDTSSLFWLDAAQATLVAQEAVAMLRDLAAASPDRHHEGLAQSLTQLAAIHEGMGQMAQADSFRHEAAKITNAGGS